MDSNSHRSLSSLRLSTSSLSFLVDELFFSRGQTRSLQRTNCLCLEKYFFALRLFSSETFSFSSLAFPIDRFKEEIQNRSLFEFIHPRDHDQLKDYLLKDHPSTSLVSLLAPRVDRRRSVLEKCRLAWRRATADEYEECQVIGAFRSSEESRR